MGMVVSQSGRVVAGPSGRASPSESAHPQEHDHGRDPKLERNVENGREPEAESDDRQTDQQQRSEVPQPPESPDEHGAKRALSRLAIAATAAMGSPPNAWPGPRTKPRAQRGNAAGIHPG